MLRPIAFGALRCGVLVALGLARLHADVTPLFDPSEISGQVLDFSMLSSGWPVSTTFVGQGVSFGYGLFGADEANTATNSDGSTYYNLIIVSFAGLSPRAGFSVRSDDSFLLQIGAWDADGNSAGVSPFFIGANYTFVGVEFSGGMSALSIDLPGTFRMQDFRFDLAGGSNGGGGDETPIPEPSSAGLAAAAILGAICIWRGRAASLWR